MSVDARARASTLELGREGERKRDERKRKMRVREVGGRKEKGTGCERDPSFSLARGWGRPFSRVLNIFMMAAGAGGAAWKWRVGGGCSDEGWRRPGVVG